MDKDLFASISSDSEDSKRGLADSKDALGDSVILDINPSKFDKAKDHLFFDFFSIYAKNFIDAKKPSRKNGGVYWK